MTHKISPTTLKVLKILNDCKVHAGSAIAKQLGISRTAVWKIIKRLKSYDVEILTHHQGYMLQAPLILLDQAKIKRLLKMPDVTLELFEAIPSTNDYLKTKTPFKNKTTCLSEFQSSGRGRLGRAWMSPFGRNIYFSFSYVFNKDICELSGLSLGVGVLIVKALKSMYSDLPLNLKWPNDIYWNDKKIGGILIDLIAEAHGNCAAIISLGLNVNMRKSEGTNIKQPWGSLEQALGKTLDRNLVVVELIHFLSKGIETFNEKGIEPFFNEWAQYDMLKEKPVALIAGQETVNGISKGIDHEGHLLLQLPSGVVEKFSYGDTSLLKS